MKAILIHGAWQGGWAWDRFLPLLANAGFAAEAIDLPGNGTDRTKPADVSLALYVAHVGGKIRASGGRVLLVAHSGGGIVASALAEAFPGQVAGIAYVAGLMLPDGGAFSDIVSSLAAGDPAARGIGPHLRWSADGLASTVPPEAARRIFYHDCRPEDADAACRRLTPQPESGRALRPRLTPERFGTVPRLYVEALLDRSVVPAAQRRMQALVPGAQIAGLESGHAPQLSMPEKLAACLFPWLAARW